MAIRFRTRFVHATVVTYLREQMSDLGWTTPPINFGTTKMTILENAPDERDGAVPVNTVVVTLGNLDITDEEELGAASGGLSSMAYPVFFDIYMDEQSLSVAVADDIRDIFENLHLPLIDQITGGLVPNAKISFEDTVGPERPDAAGGEGFRRYWRVVKTTARLYFNT
jgi:hypothetical protein